MEQKKYWKGLEELHNTDAHQEIVKNEFSEELPFESEGLLNATTPRRDFLKYLGFTTAAATIAASCETPIKKAIPYVNKPEEITPGVANYYASSYTIDGEYLPLLVKTREGRPIKIEGNTSSSITGGATTAKSQGAVLSLYDVARLRFPTIGGNETTWTELDKQVSAALAGLGGAPVVLLSTTLLSPTTKKVIGEFLAKYPNSRHVVYDAVSYSGMLDANQASFGKRVIPSYHFENAQTVVNLGADFLGTWLNPAEYSKQFAATRKINAKNPEMSKHFVFESHMSLSGANADYRYTHKPSETGKVALALLAAVNGNAVSGVDGKLAEGVKKAAAELKKTAGKSLVVSGSNDVNVQIIVNAINNAVGAYGATIDLANPSNYRQGSDAEMVKLVSDMNAGSIGAVLVYGANPAYDYFDAAKFSEGLKKVKLTVSFNDRVDETTELCKFAAPDHHFLESWNDAEGKPGYYSFVQPTIAPLFKTRAIQDTLLTWAGNTTQWVDYLKNEWIAKLGGAEAWDKVLQDGIVEPATAPAMGGGSFSGDVAAATAKIGGVKGGKYEVVLYEKVSIGNGRLANNPWLQEMPDPITRATWDNYACVSNTLAKTFSTELGDDYEINAEKKVLKITANGKTVELPLLILPGMHPEVIAIAVGYGRSEKTGKAAGGIGKNAYPFVSYNGQNFDYFAPAEAPVATGAKYPLGLTQTHNSYEGRPIIKETTLDEFKANPKEVNEDREELLKFGKDFRKDATLYPSFSYPGIKWGMSIDLNTCFGCGACTIACQAENNVSVVGKEEVVKAHEMHWLRIDRYFSGDENNPEVVFQPMLCQHCDNAPCENVCPVGATNHSSEGINQMAYNRCIGTRYCANNCPYKVRRLNWRDWNGADSFENNLYDVADMNDNLTRMVLNPDVVVRSRGVMEKCSFCVQRLQDAKLTAKKAGRPMKDGEAKTACQQACAADAIVFGNVNDKNSAIYKIRNEEQTERMYYVLEETHVLPSINYLAKIRNKDAEPKAEKEAAHKEEAHHA
ncbi:TAT-variant-translocated molybdopterin oxidoreductase [Chitinophaga sp. Cy-1792]|uniref:TAT-variant-translocated molybdopterin oxidoreductase n=1 Tax=Chitinophaga sp. Cy-1792 TaxID=2608339 RepID=UPI00141FF35E|nr:TAT-variant-translocated molybdopterin oxidoreductase [Chitinophaga sp. Cy-1792]NIG52628.1 4Fe-4S dicluster domain-containing protein [Chitinophaga sp. Cy-1792]